MTTTLPALRYDPMDPSYVKDPYPLLTRFREEAPVYYWEQGGGPVFFRYKDVIALMRDARLGHDPTLGAGFPPELKAAYPDFVALRENDLFMVPSESHARLRKLLNPTFGPRAVEAHRPKVKAIIEALLEKFPLEGVIDVSSDYTRQYPVRVIASILNIPPNHEPEFIAFAESLISTIIPGLPPERFAACMPPVSRGMALVRDIIADRRVHPMEGDLMTQLINACDEQDRLSDPELVSLVAGLLVGGTDTTYHGTNQTILSLLQNPEQLAILRAEPSLARNAFDETLRYNMFGRMPFPRYATESFEFANVSIQRGQPVFMFLMSAFRDPEYLPDANVYDIRRQHTGTHWFGLGPHFCLGASLARMEAEIALQSLLARYPKIELAGEPVWGNHPIMRTMDRLPLRVSASA
ncbi:cytochrome P450 [Polyangium sp. 6x1]|uniref:cytochrome P450 n=1 Tax=Polyangium sp. 6x1 TaxID=3042689 RepID=UPI0024830A47|nr:cytochrome P450 [Polyangium sp. 6x1]MDI1443329.1 cytochrome P450 [Polyangium sp. 6x1]